LHPAGLDRLPAGAGAEVHFTGYSVGPNLGDASWLTSRDAAAQAGAWALYKRLTARIGRRPP